MTERLAGNDRLKVVNVSSVPQRSPFRYAGGKTWLIPQARLWLHTVKATELVEPFAGGASISVMAVCEGFVDHATMIEIDAQVAAVWTTIISDGDGEWLAERIQSFDLTLDNVVEVLEGTSSSVREGAFQTIIKNRTQRGGVLAPGAGRLKNGDGRGLASRWYPETLARRIMAIDAVRDRLRFIHGDGMEFMRLAQGITAAWFIDPPYTAGGKNAGSRLYAHSDVDHDELFTLAAGLGGGVLMTYSDAIAVRERVAVVGFEVASVAMQNTHSARMTELLIGRDLSWAA